MINVVLIIKTQNTALLPPVTKNSEIFGASSPRLLNGALYLAPEMHKTATQK